MTKTRKGRQRGATVGRVVVPVSLPIPLAERLTEAADLERRTRSAFIRLAAEKEADRILGQPRQVA